MLFPASTTPSLIPCSTALPIVPAVKSAAIARGNPTPEPATAPFTAPTIAPLNAAPHAFPESKPFPLISWDTAELA